MSLADQGPMAEEAAPEVAPVDPPGASPVPKLSINSAKSGMGAAQVLEDIGSNRLHMSGPLGIAPQNNHEDPAINEDSAQSISDATTSDTDGLKSALLMSGGFLGVMLLLIGVVSGYVLYQFAYHQVTDVTNDILSAMRYSLQDSFTGATWFPVYAHHLAYSGYLQKYGGLNFVSGVSSSQLTHFEVLLVRIARSNFSATREYQSDGLHSILSFSLPDGRFTSAVFDGSKVVIQANDDTTSSGLNCAKTYLATKSRYPSRSGAATASICPQSAADQSWWRGEPLAATAPLQWSSVGGVSNGELVIPEASVGLSWYDNSLFAAQWGASVPLGPMTSVPSTYDMLHLNQQGTAMTYSADEGGLMVSASLNTSDVVANTTSRLSAAGSSSSLISAGAEEVETEYTSFSTAIGALEPNEVELLNEGSFNMVNEEPKVNAFLLVSTPGSGSLKLLAVNVLEVLFCVRTHPI